MLCVGFTSSFVEGVLYMEEGKPPFLCSDVGGAYVGKM